MNRAMQENWERALDELQARIEKARVAHPGSDSHYVTVRTPTRTAQLVVGREVPAGEIRANLEAQLALLKAREVR